ncbi:MAG: transcription antitermination factor NusB [Planctomycetota bacterium]|jgi:transcription antitermination factor NusB
MTQRESGNDGQAQKPRENNVRKRTQARVLSFQFLYMMDIRGNDCESEIDDFLAEHADDSDIIEFAGSLIRGVVDHQNAIDETIEKSAQNWELSRIATVDRNIMRQAIFELLFREDIPPKVSINEAIELGKKFSTANSGGFINGILDRIKRDNNL